MSMKKKYVWEVKRKSVASERYLKRVWHKTDQTPLTFPCKVICYAGKGFELTKSEWKDEHDYRVEISQYGLERWAYEDDLMPSDMVWSNK